MRQQHAAAASPQFTFLKIFKFSDFNKETTVCVNWSRHPIDISGRKHFCNSVNIQPQFPWTASITFTQNQLYRILQRFRQGYLGNYVVCLIFKCIISYCSHISALIYHSTMPKYNIAIERVLLNRVLIFMLPQKASNILIPYLIYEKLSNNDSALRSWKLSICHFTFFLKTIPAMSPITADANLGDFIVYFSLLLFNLKL